MLRGVRSSTLRLVVGEEGENGEYGAREARRSLNDGLDDLLRLDHDELLLETGHLGEMNENYVNERVKRVTEVDDEVNVAGAGGVAEGGPKGGELQKEKAYESLHR